MTYLLGIDTGGTYTDAILRDEEDVIASAKSLTTRHDLPKALARLRPQPFSLLASMRVTLRWPRSLPLWRQMPGRGAGSRWPDLYRVS